MDVSQQDQVVITRRGRPAAVMVGVRGEGLGGCGASDFFDLVEAYRGEEKRADDVDEGAARETIRSR